jgi:hypothetical protein
MEGRVGEILTEILVTYTRRRVAREEGGQARVARELAAL